MRPMVITQTGVGTSNWLVADHHVNVFNMSAAVLATGTVTYTVEYTYDDVLNGATATVYSPTALTAQTTSKDAPIAFPIMAIRVNVTAGTGSARLTVLQAGVK